MCRVDIQEKNIMLNVEDTSILLAFEEDEMSDPTPRKIVGDRSIYCSRRLRLPKIHGRPILSDFEAARFGSTSRTCYGEVQPFKYRSPEVVFRMPWDEKIDIWNLGVVVCAVVPSYAYLQDLSNFYHVVGLGSLRTRKSFQWSRFQQTEFR